jgi:hypothetical protein
MSSFLTRVNKTAVTAELLGEVVAMRAAAAGRSQRVRDPRASDVRTAGREGARVGDGGKLAMGVDIRLQAFAVIVRDGKARGWITPGSEPGQVSISSDLLRTVAEEPLIEGPDGQATFDATSFQRRVLGITESRGHA